MKTGRWFISTGFRRAKRHWWRGEIAVHRRWRLAFVRPWWSTCTWRLYVGPIEIGWSFIRTASHEAQKEGRGS